MAQGATFTRPTAERIIRATRAVEAEQLGTPGQRIHGPRPVYSTAASMAAVVVRTRDFASDSEILTVTPVAESETGVYFDDAHTREMWTWFGLRARHYAPLAQVTGDYGEATNVLPAVQVGKKWRVLQQVRWGFPLLEERFKVEGCLPVIVP